MSKDCNECGGKMIFYDGSFQHEPKFICINCGLEKLCEEIKWF